MNFPVIFKTTAQADRFWLWVKRILIVMGVIGFSAVGGLAANYGLKALAVVLVGALGLAGLYFADRIGRSEFGILALVPLATLVNFFTLPTGTNSRIVLSLALALGLVGLWVFQVWFSRREPVRVQPSPVNLPLILFIVVNFVALVWSELLRDPLLLDWEHYRIVRIAAMVVIVLLPMLTLFVGNKITEVRWLQWIVVLTLASGILIVFSNFFRLPLSFLYWNGSRGLFTTWVGCTALALALFNEKLELWLRGLLISLAGAVFLQGFLGNTHWLSAWLPLGVSGVMVIFLRSRKLFAVLIVALALAALIQHDWIQEYIVQANLDEGSGNRLDLWLVNLGLVFKHPVFGVGPAGYAPYYMTYHPTAAMSTHNNYFDVLAQTGFVGLAIFLWMMAAIITIGFKLKRRLEGNRNFEEAFVNAVVAGLIAAMVSMMLGDWVLPFAYNQTISGFDNAMFTWLYAGGLLALYHRMKKRGDFNLSEKVANDRDTGSTC